MSLATRILGSKINRSALKLAILSASIAGVGFTRGWGFWTVLGAYLAGLVAWSVVAGWSNLLKEGARRATRAAELKRAETRRRSERATAGVWSREQGEILEHRVKFKNVSPLTPAEEDCEVYVDTLNDRAYQRLDDNNWTDNDGVIVRYDTTVAELRIPMEDETSYVVVRHDFFTHLVTTVQDMASEIEMRNERARGTFDPPDEQPRTQTPTGRRVIDLG